MKITGEIIVLKNKSGNGYYITTSNKNEDGTFDRNYMSVGFRKGVEVEHFSKIDIKDGFLTHYSYQNENGENIKRFKIVIMDFDVLEVYSNSNNETPANDEMANIYPDDDLPF